MPRYPPEPPSQSKGPSSPYLSLCCPMTQLTSRQPPSRDAQDSCLSFPCWTQSKPSSAHPLPFLPFLSSRDSLLLLQHTVLLPLPPASMRHSLLFSLTSAPVLTCAPSTDTSLSPTGCTESNWCHNFLVHNYETSASMASLMSHDFSMPRQTGLSPVFWSRPLHPILLWPHPPLPCSLLALPALCSAS